MKGTLHGMRASGCSTLGGYAVVPEAIPGRLSIRWISAWSGLGTSCPFLPQGK